MIQAAATFLLSFFKVCISLSEITLMAWMPIAVSKHMVGSKAAAMWITRNRVIAKDPLPNNLKIMTLSKRLRKVSARRP